MQILNLVSTLLLGGFVAAQVSAGDERPNVTYLSDPNPIGALYPLNVTGTTNGTIALLPIPLELACTIIPRKWDLRHEAIQEVLPGFPATMYPLVIQFVFDHDVGIGEKQLVPDFQTVRLLFPFVDYLGNGFTSFVYSKYIVVTDGDDVVFNATESYGNIPVAATFKPIHEAYDIVPEHTHNKRNLISSTAFNTSGYPIVQTMFESATNSPWAYDFFTNVTGQPQFSDAEKCHYQETFFNTSLSTGAHTPVPIVGNVTIDPFFLGSSPNFTHITNFTNVYGMKMDYAFVENYNVSCDYFAGPWNTLSSKT